MFHVSSYGCRSKLLMQSILRMMSQNRHEPNDKVEKNNNLLNREKNELIPRSKLLKCNPSCEWCLRIDINLVTQSRKKIISWMTYVFWDIARMLYPNKWKYRNSEFRNKALFFEEMHIFIFREAWKKFPNLNGKKTDFSSSTKVYKFTKNQYFNFLKKINYIQSLRLLCNFDTFWKKVLHIAV